MCTAGCVSGLQFDDTKAECVDEEWLVENRILEGPLNALLNAD